MFEKIVITEREISFWSLLGVKGFRPIAFATDIPSNDPLGAPE